MMKCKVRLMNGFPFLLVQMSVADDEAEGGEAVEEEVNSSYCLECRFKKSNK